MTKTPLTKYLCQSCDREFLTIEQSKETEEIMCCMVCKEDVIPVAGPYEDEDGLYDEMGCLYPGGL